MFCAMYLNDYQVFASSGIKAYSEPSSGRQLPQNLISLWIVLIFWQFISKKTFSRPSSFPSFLLKNTSKDQRCGSTVLTTMKMGLEDSERFWVENKPSTMIITVFSEFCAFFLTDAQFLKSLFYDTISQTFYHSPFLLFLWVVKPEKQQEETKKKNHHNKVAINYYICILHITF